MSVSCSSFVSSEAQDVFRSCHRFGPFSEPFLSASRYAFSPNVLFKCFVNSSNFGGREAEYDSLPASSSPPLKPAKLLSATKTYSSVRHVLYFRALTLGGPVVLDDEVSESDPPPIIIGRGEELRKIYASFEKKQHVVVTGEIGMGKSTLAQAAFHSPRIVERYRRRIWISCDNFRNARDSFDSMIALIPSSNNKISWSERVEDFATEPTLIVLDNLETPSQELPILPTDLPQARERNILNIRALISYLRVIPTVSMIITTRMLSMDTSHDDVPGHLNLITLQPLSPSLSEVPFCHRARNLVEDQNLPTLLRLLDGHPLALAIVSAAAAREATASKIISLWEEKGPATFDAVASRKGSVSVSVDRAFSGGLWTVLLANNFPESSTLLGLLAIAQPMSTIRFEAICDILIPNFNRYRCIEISSCLSSLGFTSRYTDIITFPNPIAAFLSNPNSTIPSSSPSEIYEIARSFAKDVSSFLPNPPNLPADRSTLLRVFSFAYSSLEKHPHEPTSRALDFVLLTLVQDNFTSEELMLKYPSVGDLVTTLGVTKEEALTFFKKRVYETETQECLRSQK